MLRIIATPGLMMSSKRMYSSIDMIGGNIANVKEVERKLGHYSSICNFRATMKPHCPRGKYMILWFLRESYIACQPVAGLTFLVIQVLNFCNLSRNATTFASIWPRNSTRLSDSWTWRCITPQCNHNAAVIAKWSNLRVSIVSASSAPLIACCALTRWPWRR